MIRKLGDLKADLIARRRQAEAEGWHGEIEGLDLTLSHLRDKRARTRRFTQRTPPGLPRPPAPRA